MFVDQVEIRVEAGKGGDGCLSFRREKYVPRGGPDGGDGGDAGSVLLEADEDVDSLAELAQRKHWKAQSGTPGSGANRHGRRGEDLVLRVPPGTMIYDAQTDLLLKDLSTAGERVCAAHGGKGGKGNARFKSATNRAPRQFTRGSEGETRLLRLELKLIADVGLAGKPNAGKSTLLSRLSRARPRIADYPFTTKIPNLGIVQIDIDRSLVLADIPGLIEGAHAGAGLGHEFLRHIERTRVLVHLVEPMPSDGSDPVDNYRAIRQELEKYSNRLIERPELIAVSKADLPAAEEVRQRLAAETGRNVHLFSAVTGEGLNRLKGEMVTLLDQAGPEKSTGKTAAPRP